MERSRGFTLIEAMVTIVLLAVFVSTAVPSYQWLLTRNRVVSEINSFVATLQLARTEAIKRGQTVRVCTSSSGTGCSTSADWDDGWLVFVDTDDDGDFDSNETRLRVGQGFSSGDRFTGNTHVAHKVSFTRIGFVTQGGSLTLCPSSGNTSEARAIVISLVGRVRLAEDDDGDGIVETSGSNVSCAP
jgi:type IV fimbrial biogenesis protein FimT